MTNEVETISPKPNESEESYIKRAVKKLLSLQSKKHQALVKS